MKKELISFTVDESVSDKIIKAALLDFKINQDENNLVKFPIIKDWKNYTAIFEDLIPQFQKLDEYIRTEILIEKFENNANKLYQSLGDDENNLLISELQGLDKIISEMFSDKNKEPLKTYPLFIRWFTVSVSLNVISLRKKKIVCLDCIEFWSGVKKYLDKTVVFMISKLQSNSKFNLNNDIIIEQLEHFQFNKNYELLNHLEESLVIHEHSLIKKDDLLNASHFFNKTKEELKEV